MPPKRKNQEPITRRSSRSTAAPKPIPANSNKEPSTSKKLKIAVDDKPKPNDDEVELFSPRPKKANSVKDKKEKSVGNGAAVEEVKIVKKGNSRGKVDVDEESPASVSTVPKIISRTIVIEACTQCKSFKERAEKVKKGLESAVSGVTVKINPQKPRQGYFEISEERTEVILSLPDMKRPFEPMKMLNMDELVGDLVKRFK